MNKREGAKQIRTVADPEERKQVADCPPVNLPNPIRSTSTVPQPRIDATNRRQIEAQNEDKAHTTKETLDDIKRIHQKEKNKKQETDIDLVTTGNASEGEVS